MVRAELPAYTPARLIAHLMGWWHQPKGPSFRLDRPEVELVDVLGADRGQRESGRLCRPLSLWFRSPSRCVKEQPSLQIPCGLRRGGAEVR